MSRARRAGWLAAYATLTFLSFPHLVGERVLDLGTPLAFLAPAALWCGLEGLAPRAALRAGFAAGLAAHGLVLHWIYVVTVTYGHAWPPIGVVAVLLLATYIAAHTSLLAGASAWLAARGVAGPFALAALWTAIDHLRSFSLTGFPWATLGYALHADGPLRALASVGGVYALSFAAALGGASLAALAARRRRAALAGLAGLAALHALGAGLLVAAPAGGGGRVATAVVQGNIDQGRKWSPQMAEETLVIYEALTREAAARGARLVAWPETAVPGSLDVDRRMRARLEALARETGATLVVGAVGVDGYDPSRAGQRRALAYYDSGYVIDPARGVVDRYDKAHLVPFGEYVPFRGLIGRFVSAVATGIASGDVSEGPSPRRVALPGAGPDGADLPAGIAICYELLFPDLMRRFAADGAQVSIAITNDAWYGRTGAPHQFLVMTALRAAESGRPVARAANTGVSALIDAQGTVRSRTRIFERDLLVGEVELAAADERPTFYVRHGDVFAFACWAAVAVAAFRGWRRRSAGAEAP
ncbi:MAG TPA: apolipoprotein N-acyltransferase [Myxococcota bacterium]|nr:apolipoprotein N-acyltransferase [Myxococcota bacterium]